MLPHNKSIPQVVAHIDLLPTILDFCGLHSKIPSNIDGSSLLALIKGDTSFAKGRYLYWQWVRGFPIPFQNFAIRKGDYKLVGNTGYSSKLTDFELYDVKKNPRETKNIINSNIEIAKPLKERMIEWWRESIINNPANREIARAEIGTAHENPVILEGNDAIGFPDIWTQDNIIGYWHIRIKTTGLFDVTVKFINPISSKGTLYLQVYPFHYTLPNNHTGITELTFKEIPLSTGDFKLEAYYEISENKSIMPFYVEVKKIPDKIDQ